MPKMPSAASTSGQTPLNSIANIVVKTTPAGAPVRIGDIAAVLPSVMPVYTVVTANGKPAVLLNILRQPTGNTVTVADAVHAEIEQIRKELPKTAVGKLSKKELKEEERAKAQAKAAA